MWNNIIYNCEKAVVTNGDHEIHNKKSVAYELT